MFNIAEQSLLSRNVSYFAEIASVEQVHNSLL